MTVRKESWQNDEKWNEKKDLGLDELEEVSGGRVKAAGYATLLAAMRILKKNGKDKEYAKRMVIDGWGEDCPYKVTLTDGTDEDLQNTLAFIDKNW